MKKTFVAISLGFFVLSLCFLSVPVKSEASIGFSIGLGMGNMGFYNQPFMNGGYYPQSYMGQPYVGVNNFNSYYGGYMSPMSYNNSSYSPCFQSCYGRGGYNGYSGYNSAPFIDLGPGAMYAGSYQQYNPYNNYNMYGYGYSGQSCFRAPCFY